MLRITIISENEDTMRIRLEGRIAGPWAEEFNRVWVETAPSLGARKLSIDLSEVTYADSTGKAVLSNVIAQTGAELIAGTVWTQDLVRQVVGK
jgi:anti-anti-sigma regulatory factor